MTDTPFGHERDQELGDLLRTHLEADRHEAFVAQVRNAIRTDAMGPFDVLGAWMRPGIAAAALIAVAAGWWLTTGTRTEIATSNTPVEVFATGGGADLMLATSLEAR